MGWNSWNSGIALDEQSVRETVDAMVSSGMRDAGYRYVNLDAGWAAPTRGPDGRLRPDPTRFPNGMGALAQYAHDRGLQFGLYASPFNQTCGQDPRMASAGHEERDAQTFAGWGVDYLKYDWCRADADHDDQIRVFTAMRKALRASGRHVVYSINPNGVGDLTAGSRYDWSGIADAVRTTGDLVPLWRDVLPHSGPDDPFVTGFYRGVPAQFEQAAGVPRRPAYRNDPDMLVVGVRWADYFHDHLSTGMPADFATIQPGLSDDEQRSHFSLWAMLSAPLLAGNDLRSMTPDTRAILTNREVIAVDQDPMLAVARSLGDGRVWAKSMADASVVVALFNSGDSAANLETSASSVGLPQAPCYTERDLWQHTSSTTTGTIAAPALAPHSVRLLRVSAVC
ncbi:glycoside hydrolase family 27 protein [Mycolicibacterium moriokaense]|nr:glycoside hydrolase family 27 protein [Mycolicibacterium moriokaense]